jgi:hypothetical protein
VFIVVVLVPCQPVAVRPPEVTLAPTSVGPYEPAAQKLVGPAKAGTVRNRNAPAKSAANLKRIMVLQTKISILRKPRRNLEHITPQTWQEHV